MSHTVTQTSVCGKVLAEVVWKVVTVNINFRFIASIAFNEVLHGFRAGRGTGTFYPVRDLSGTAQGVWHLGQGQMPGYLVEVLRGTFKPPHP